MNQEVILPFYMAYPYSLGNEEQERRMRDLEYIQQLYPKEAKNILKKVLLHIEPIDYTGSFLYDEYPDRLMLYRIVAAIFNEMKKDAENRCESWSPEKELWMQDMIKLVLYLELFKRRCKKNQL